MQKAQRYLLYIAILLSPFQDTILSKSALGFIGANISSIPIAAHASLGILLWLKGRRMPVSRPMVWWGLYAMALSIAYVLAWGPMSHGFSVIYKVFSIGLTCLLSAYTIFFIDYSSSAGLRRSTSAAFLITLFGVLVCDLHMPGFAAIGSSTLLHVSPEIPGRWRSFTVEPSMLSATVISLGFIAAHLVTTKAVRISIFAVTVAVLVASQSKGALLVLVFSWLILLVMRKPSFGAALGYITIAAVVIVPMGYLVLQSLTVVDIADATGSFATRITMAVWTFIVLMHHPWGVGFSGFYEAITIYLPKAIAWMNDVSPLPLNFIEVSEYVSGTDVPLDTKCFFLEYAVTFGVPFIAAYFVFSKRILAALLKGHRYILLVGSIFTLLSLATYVNGLALYSAFFLLGMGYREYRQQAREAARLAV